MKCVGFGHVWVAIAGATILGFGGYSSHHKNDRWTLIFWRFQKRRSNQDEKNSLKIKFWGRIFLQHEGPTRRDIPDPGPVKAWCKVPFSVVLDREWSGCSAIWVTTSRELENFSKKTLGWFSVPLWMTNMECYNYFGQLLANKNYSRLED